MSRRGRAARRRRGRPRPHGDRGRGHRRLPARARDDARVRQGPQAVRRARGLVPGGQPPLRADAAGHREHPLGGVLRRVGGRRRPGPAAGGRRARGGGGGRRRPRGHAPARFRPTAESASRGRPTSTGCTSAPSSTARCSAAPSATARRSRGSARRGSGARSAGSRTRRSRTAGGRALAPATDSTRRTRLVAVRHRCGSPVAGVGPGRPDRGGRRSGAGHATLLLGRGPLPGARAEPQATLRAAVARIVPASGPGDWSAADVGADNYILTLLAIRPTPAIYAGGPFRSRFARFQQLSRIKRIGWSREVKRLASCIRPGLAQLDQLAGGNFATAAGTGPGLHPDQAGLRRQRVLRRALQPHVRGRLLPPDLRRQPRLPGLEGVRLRRRCPRRALPPLGPPGAPWNVYGGYAPEEMVQPGKEKSRP